MSIPPRLGRLGWLAGADWARVQRLSALTRDGLLADISGLLRLAYYADADGMLPSPTAHRVVADPSILDRLYHVGLVHLYCDPPCCGTPRRRECYSIHRYTELASPA